MIQDIYPHRLDNHYRPDATPEKNSIVFCFQKQKILALTQSHTISFPHRDEVAGVKKHTYLFSIDEQMFFLGEGEHILTPKGYAYLSVRELRQKSIGPKHLIFAAITALQIHNWYDNNRYCGRCGIPMQASGAERALICPHCGHIVYPRIVPAVIVGVTHGDEILMTKYAGRNIPFYALVAGFTEIGETLEQTVEREVMEEVGLKVKNIRYYKSQPWGIVDDLLAGFFCEVDGSTEIHMDRSELKVAEWMKREDVEGQPDDFSLTNEMMMVFRDGKEYDF